MNIKFIVFLLGILLSAGLFTSTEHTFAQGQPIIPEFSIAACSYAGGSCQIGDANCRSLNTTSPPQFDFIGYCNTAETDSCCKRKLSATGPGSDSYCTTTLAGNCRQASQGCGTTATNVGPCTTDAAGTGRVCCRTNPVAAPTPLPTTVTGPQIGNYTLLEQLPGSTNSVQTGGRLNLYLQDIYKFAFWTVGIAVVFMLTIGGFMYLTSAGNTSRMESAKTVIFDSILGLVLALVAWLFLYVINPNLVKTTLPSAGIPVTTTPAPVVGGNNQTLAGQIRTGVPGLSLSSTGSCSGSAGVVSPVSSIAQSAAGTPVTACQNGCPGSGQCNSSTALSETMLRGLINVASQWPLTVSSFTGGSHSNGSRHYSGRAVDVVPSAPNKSDWLRIQTAFRGQGATLVICDITVGTPPRTIDVNCDDPRADHIHAEW